MKALKHCQDAEDVAQEIFERVYRFSQAQKIKNRELHGFESFVMKVASNECCVFFRQKESSSMFVITSQTLYCPWESEC